MLPLFAVKVHNLSHPGSEELALVMRPVHTLKTFGTFIEDGPVAEISAKVFLVQLLSCLTHCHQRNVVHRDIKVSMFPMCASFDTDQHRIMITHYAFGKLQMNGN